MVAHSEGIVGPDLPDALRQKVSANPYHHRTELLGDTVNSRLAAFPDIGSLCSWTLPSFGSAEAVSQGDAREAAAERDGYPPLPLFFTSVDSKGS